jgi:DivIVA domain-containing protein
MGGDMLTPQAIKDQEFQIKFRGYDAIEVKAYLELLAEDFYELTEQNRTQTEELEALQAEHEAVVREKDALAAEIRAGQENAEGIQSEIQEGYQHKDKEINELRAEVARQKTLLETLEAENKRKLEKLSSLEQKVQSETSGMAKDQAELERLRAKVEFLEERNNELKQEGVDFKTTILAAQKFADNLRETTQNEAKRMMDEARAEVEKFRTDSEAELAYLPKEIEALRQRKDAVREDLKRTLQSYLESLDIFPELQGKGEDDLSDLFESIKIPDGDEGVAEVIDTMDIDLPETN